MSYSYDDIFGVDLDTYCAAHSTTIEALVEKIDRDVDLLNYRMKRLMEVPFMEQDVALTTYLYKLINKKQKHKQRLLDWAAESKHF